MIKPVEIAIAGVQKAATSSLQVYIGTHPDVITHDEREFSFFVQDDEYEKGYANIYHDYFPLGDSTGKILIKNVGIFFWEDAMQRLQNHNPGVKIILVLRNPVERAYSAYWYARSRGKENENTFEDALKVSENKIYDKESKAVTAYLQRGNYVSQLNALYKYFNPRQVKIILFEHLKETPGLVLSDVFNFCELSSYSMKEENKKLKHSSQPRISWLASLANQQNAVKSALKKMLPGKTRQQLRLKLNEINKKEFIPPPMKSKTKQMLIEHYKPMVNELSELLRCDLSGWNK